MSPVESSSSAYASHTGPSPYPRISNPRSRSPNTPKIASPPPQTLHSGDTFAYSPTHRRTGSRSSVESHPGALGSFAESSAKIKALSKKLGVGINGVESQHPFGDELTESSGDKSNHVVTPSELYASQSVEDTLKSHHPTTPSTGLPSALLEDLRAIHGPNEFQADEEEHILLKFAKQIYENPLVLLLLGSAGVSLLVGNRDDAISIAIAVLIVLTVGFVQEQRSEKSLQALSKLVPHSCHLIRDSHPQTLLANDLVPGDIVHFSVGDRVPADIRLITAVGLEIDESALTGETRPARKRVEACDSEGVPGGKTTIELGDRHCVAFMGTLVKSGHGSGVVVATGSKTEFGVIFSMMQDVEEKRTPLQLSMDELATQLSFLSFGIIGIIVLIGVYQKRSWLEMFTIGVSLAVAAIPEGLPIVTTVTLALGVLRMSNKQAIVKKLPSVEVLGSVSVICSDKTGTLTKNEMTVTTIYTVDDTVTFDEHHSPPENVSPALRKTVQIGNLCNNSFADDDGCNVGQATDVAILNVLDVFGWQDQRDEFERTTEIPFSSDSKYMVVSGKLAPFSQTRELVYLKGSIEAVLDRCESYYVSDSSTPSLNSTTRNTILAKASDIASTGLRVVAMAYGQGSALDFETSSSGGGGLVFAGFQAMLDPPRKGVADAIAHLQLARIHVVMITGDAEQTAVSIARTLGLKMGPGRESCLTGKELDGLTEKELQEKVNSISVFARVTPKHKMMIISAFQKNGEVVAMTGDGVNDAPALKMAEIGISMGKSGTDVAKEAADVILVDDNFATILPAVEEGKSIFYNIQNFLVFQLSTAVAALSIITITTAFGLSNPLNAMQILFINILMDGPPAQALGVDPVDPAIMKRPPRPRNAPILSKRLFARVFFSAAIIVVGTLYMFLQETQDGRLSRRDQTMTFTTFVFLDLASAIQNRGLSCRLVQNKMLFLTCSISFLAQLGLIYLPFLQGVFQTQALSLRDFGTVLAFGLGSVTLHEGRRMWERILIRREDHANSLLITGKDAL